jgi:hypothetical protein
MVEDRNNDATKLRLACQNAFLRYPDSCSTAVWYVIQQYKPNQPHMTANDLLRSIASSQEWQEVPLAEVSQIANTGGVVVGGLQEPNHGHVVIAFPGDEKFDGGFVYFNKKTEKNVEAAATGIFPVVMSTSMGNWPGAKSNGDKTARDPWPAEKFKRVRFWKLLISGQNIVPDLPGKNLRWNQDRDSQFTYDETSKANNTSNKLRWQLNSDSMQGSLPMPGPIRWSR